MQGYLELSFTLKCSLVLGQLASIRQLVTFFFLIIIYQDIFFHPSFFLEEVVQLSPSEKQTAEAIYLHVDLYKVVWVAGFVCRAGGKGCSEVTVLTVRVSLFSWQHSPFVLLINGFAGGR